MNPQFTTNAAPAEPLANWVPVLPASVGLLLLFWGLWGVRKHLSLSRELFFILVVALVVRLFWMPTELHIFDGHEAEYFDIFRGERSISRGSVMLYPTLQWLYGGLGKLGSSPWLLLSISVLGSLLSIAATYGIGRRLFDRRVALTATSLLAVWGNHAFWATSAYNVALPLAFGLMAVWGLLICADESETTRAASLASGAAVVAVSMRIETLLLAPLGLLLFVLRRPRVHWTAWALLGAGAIMSGLAIALVLSAGPLPGDEERGAAFALNVFHLGFWDPLHGWAGFALLGAAALGIWKSPRPTLPLLAFLLGLHLAISSFNDAGFRHSMLGLWAIALVLGLLANSGGGRLALVAVFGAVLLHTQDVAERYYLSEEDFGKTLSQAPDFPFEDLSECVLICEDSRVVSEGQQRSHFNLLYPNPNEDLWTEKGCVYWLLGVQDARWSSRAVRDRALRVLDRFETTVRGRLALSNGYVGSVLEVKPLQ